MQPKMILCCLATLLVPVFAQDPERLAAALKERALLDGVTKLNTDDRLKMYQTLVDTKPETLHYQNLLATAYIQKMRETTDPVYLTRAGQVIDSVLSQDGSNYEALRIKNEIELEHHHFKNVAAASRKLVQLAPDDPWNWGTLGDALMEMGDYPGAADAYQKMVTLRPDLSSYNRAAWYRYVVGDPEGAIQLMKMALQAGSRSAEHMAWCWVELGNLFLRTNRPAEARPAFERASRYLANYHPAVAGLGRTLTMTGDLPAAIAAFRQAQAINPAPEYAAALHDLYAATGNKAEAQKQLSLVDVVDKMERAAKQPANRTLVLIYANLDHQLPRALELAQGELDIRQDVFSYDALAWALLKNGQLEAAQEAMTKALKMGTPEAGFHYHAGMIAAALGKKADAVRELQLALTLNPQFDLRQAPIAQAKLKELSTGEATAKETR